MAPITLDGSPTTTSGELPAVGTPAPSFSLVAADLSTIGSADIDGTCILNVFPSVDTGVCAASVRRFNAEAATVPDATVLCVSRDLPFAQARFCGAEGIDGVRMGSDFRGGGFGEAFGVTIEGGAFAGLLARAVVVVGPDGIVRHAELVPEIAQEPDYAAALAAARAPA